MSSGNQTELARKEANLIATIDKMLPDFGRACHAPDTPLAVDSEDRFIECRTLRSSKRARPTATAAYNQRTPQRLL